jgi:predicted dehydrogenase
LWRRDREQADRLAREYGVAAAASVEELVEPSRVDAVLVLTPPGAHATGLRLAVERDLPVLVEKPVLSGWAEVERLAELDTSRVMVAQTLRFSPVLARVRELLPELGPLHRIRMAQRLAPSPLAWQRDPALAGGGSVLLTGVHLFDWLRHLLGRTPDAVQARLQRLLGHPLENLFDATFEYEDLRLLAATEVSKFSPGRAGLLDLVAERGQLLVDYLAGTIDRIGENGRERIADLGNPPTLPPTLAAFGQWLRGESACPVSYQDGVETLRMAEACYRSHRSSRRVRLDEI